MIESQTEAIERRNRELRGLSYLELCTVPAIVPTYLELFDASELRDILILNSQTFFHLHSTHLNYNPRTTQYQKFLEECLSKPIGYQLIKLLRAIVLFAMEKNFPLELILLKLDQNTDLYVTSLFKIILKSLTDQSQEIRIHGDYIAATFSLLELAVELNEVRMGNSKFICGLCDKIEDSRQTDKEEYLKTKKIEQIEQLLVMLSGDMNQHYQTLANFGLNLIKEYQFVMIEPKTPSEKKDCKNKSYDQIIDLEPEEEKIQIEFDQTIFDNFNFQRSLQEKQKYLTNLCIDCLKNIDNLPFIHLSRAFNTVSVAISESFETAYVEMDVEDISKYKSNNYCLLLSLKILIQIKQNNFIWPNLLFDVKQTLKSIFQFKMPKLQKMWLLLYSLIQVDLQKGKHVDNCIEMFDWIIQYYKEHYPIKETDYIYGEYLILCKSVLTSWKENRFADMSSKYQILQEIKKWLSKSYEKHEFQYLFQTINIKLLHYIAFLIFTQQNKIKITTFEQKDENKTQYESLLSTCENRLNRSLTFLKNSREEGNANQIEGQEYYSNIFDIILNIWLQKLPGDFEIQQQWVVFVKMSQIIKILINESFSLELKERVISHQAHQMSRNCIKLIITHINSLLLASSVSKIKSSTPLQKESIEGKNQEELIQILQFLTAFLLFLLFIMNPNKNMLFYLHSIVINGFLNEDSLEELARSVLKNTSNVKEVSFSEDDFSSILKYAPTYDVLQCFYDCVVFNNNVSYLKDKYDLFCREWCSKEEHYQWLSQQKMKKVKMITFKEYGQAHLENIFSI